jgi:hypothetical protein
MTKVSISAMCDTCHIIGATPVACKAPNLKKIIKKIMMDFVDGSVYTDSNRYGRLIQRPYSPKPEKKEHPP